MLKAMVAIILPVAQADIIIFMINPEISLSKIVPANSSGAVPGCHLLDVALYFGKSSPAPHGVCAYLFAHFGLLE